MKKNKILIIIIILSILGFLLSGYKLINYRIEETEIIEQTKIINENTTINEVLNNDNTEVIKQEEEIQKEDPYWDYIKMSLIDVDFSNLKKINKDVKGWIQVKNTNINYPFVQTSNNTFYLNHSFNKEVNSAGWVFQDYRNEKDDKNTILYAHGRIDNTMFGSLKKILTSGWLNNSKNHIIKISTENENTLWQVFSVYHIKTTSDYIKIGFRNDEIFEEFVQKLISRSEYNFNTSVSKKDRILTLSTCYNNKEKMVLHAKLIKRESK